MAAVNRVMDELDLSLALVSVATPEQDKVVVICTVAQGERDSPFAPDELAAQLPDEVALVVVPAHLAWSLRKRLGDELSVSNGAARVYPVRSAGRDYEAPLIFPGRARLKDLSERLVAVASGAARAANPTRTPSPSAPTVRPRPGMLPAIPRAPRRGAASGTPSNAVQGNAAQGAVTLLETTEVDRFVDHLLNPARARPVVLISRPAGSATAMVDSARIAEELDGLAEVYEIATGAASWALAGALARYPGTEVYGGAARTYPLGTGWTTEPHRSPLRFILSPSEAEEITEKLIADASSMAFAGGYRTRRSAETRLVSGVVEGVVSGRALVRLDGGRMASILPELTVADVDAQHLFAPGMPVSGLLDSRLGRLDVSESVRPAQELVSHYAVGDQVLARVLVVESDLCVVELLPGLQVGLGSEEILDTSQHVDLRQWLTPQETLTAVVKEVGVSDDEWRLSVLEVDRDRPVLPAPALLPQGPPWLIAPAVTEEPVPPAPEPEAAPAVRAPQPAGGETQEAPRATTDEFAALRTERDSLAADLLRARRALLAKEDELRRRKAQARDANNEVAKLRRSLASSEAAVRAADADAVAFTDPVEQLDYDVRLAWARRIPAAEKRALPLAGYTLGPDFLDSLQHIQGVDRGKVIEVLVDVLTGRVHQLHGRATHQLRTGTGGGDPFVSRPDGATCWRVSLQHKTPQARRLHYWQLNDGTIELSAIRLHDDFRP
ncbi:MAG TPA: hypothetical protein PKE40_05370 [Arachnia sp.]|nr:hypothetical protein [Arachnia sp.]HMT85765.1 hypothetical protein [Arachnia sp.]